jgi:PASTA domain
VHSRQRDPLPSPDVSLHQTVVVPTLIGLSVHDARDVLDGVGLRLDDVRKGVDGWGHPAVVDQDPPPGAEVPVFQGRSLSNLADVVAEIGGAVEELQEPDFFDPCLDSEIC